MREQRDFYERQAEFIVQLERESRELSFEQVFERLKDYGWTASDAQVLITKVNRGKFSFAFAMQVLAAMGVKKIDIPDFYAKHPKVPRPSSAPKPPAA